MMPGMNKFWKVTTMALFAALGVIVLSLLILTSQLTPKDLAYLRDLLKQYAGHMLITGLFLFFILGWALDVIYKSYISPIRKLSEETALINSANPAHRIQAGGGPDIRRLCREINAGADRYESLAQNVEAKIHLAKSELETEKNTLAAMMAELPEGILICNQEGDILFYNQRAKVLLTGDLDDPIHSVDEGESARYLGLRRSVFDIIDKHLVSHALDDIFEKLKQSRTDAVAYFVYTGIAGSLLKVETVPILNQKGHFSGFILIIHDITQQLETDNHINLSFKSLLQKIRASLAGIRTAVETILEYPDIDRTQLETFSRIIHDESINISHILEANASDHSSRHMTPWPLIGISTRDLADMIIQKSQAKLSVDISWQKMGEDSWVEVDSYSFTLAVLFLVHQLNRVTEEYAFQCRIENIGRFVGLDFIWQGNPIKIENLRKWRPLPVQIVEEGISLKLGEVLRHHRADFGSYTEKENGNRAYLRLFLPATEAPKPGKSKALTVLPESRPEFYDFDLFRQPVIPEALSNRPLSELTYTVFDTETTGLNPEGGDEILSIGAYRIVNCRLLREEYFNQLIDPRRSIPLSSIKIHGIQPDMLKNQPTIDKVLPMFHRFTAETILVAHNAAFDIKFLQMKQEESGVQFVCPVLDTLLISAVVHPAQEDHNIEAIADRLSVPIVGRHTALGDAFTTGQLFLKMLPLLAQKNIHTLKETLAACEKTYYARLK
jgi:DNA polymerase-3 subunit epsilon